MVMQENQKLKAMLESLMQQLGMAAPPPPQPSPPLQPQQLQQTSQPALPAVAPQPGNVLPKRRVTLAELISLKQNKNESTLDFIKRWRDMGMKCEQPPAHEDAVKLCQRSLKPEIKEKLLGANI
ncbi:hypothetical protein Taro_042744 [Colocasia esculenta]|uniref:Uncharacterized protein n=1 Tax=Colocasia esculenta TaxID=4460 RepID=A0A843WEP4_COLES|nr:hypothetical protein [Colocasia esculenta]